MIASDRKALKVGSSRLVVDGTDTTLVRKAEISLSPSRVQSRGLEALVALSREVYNAAPSGVEEPTPGTGDGGYS